MDKMKGARIYLKVWGFMRELRYPRHAYLSLLQKY